MCTVAVVAEIMIYRSYVQFDQAPVTTSLCSDGGYIFSCKHLFVFGVEPVLFIYTFFFFFGLFFPLLICMGNIWIYVFICFMLSVCLNLFVMGLFSFIPFSTQIYRVDQCIKKISIQLCSLVYCIIYLFIIIIIITIIFVIVIIIIISPLLSLLL